MRGACTDAEHIYAQTNDLLDPTRQHFQQFAHCRFQGHRPPQRFLDVRHGHVVERHAGRMVEHDAWQHDLFARW
jgi:hypothetical protein